jgi:hypothetical protein
VRKITQSRSGRAATSWLHKTILKAAAEDFAALRGPRDKLQQYANALQSQSFRQCHTGQLPSCNMACCNAIGTV